MNESDQGTGGRILLPVLLFFVRGIAETIAPEEEIGYDRCEIFSASVAECIRKRGFSL